MQITLRLTYEGPAVDAGQMDVYSVAANMVAFSDFVVASAASVYGDQAQARADVRGFRPGSFVTELAITVGGPLATLFSTFSPVQLLETISDAVALWKHLRGEPPLDVAPTSSQSIQVTNNAGQIYVFNTHSVKLVFGEKSTESVGQFIRKALSSEGMDAVSIEAPDTARPPVKVTQDESGWFVPVAPETELFDQSIKAVLNIEAPYFKDGNKWRFSDGDSSFHAELADPDFLQRVDQGEPFAKHDSLTVELRIRQRRQGERLVTERTILKVLEHRSGHRQSKLPL